MTIDYEGLTRDQFQRYCQERAREVCVFPGAEDSLCIVLGDVPMHVVTDDDGLTKHLVSEGYWESWVSLAVGRRVQRLVGPAPVGVRPGVLNIGANAGYYLCLCASLGAAVCAVEPQEHLARVLRANITRNRFSSSVVVEAAMGATESIVTLHVPGQKYMDASLRSPGSSEGVRRVSVQQRSLFHFGRYDYVLCDAEGWEPHIFQPGESWLRKHRPVVTMEFSPQRYTDPVGFARWWRTIGYEPLVIEYDGSEVPVDLVSLAEAGTERMVTLVPLPSTLQAVRP